MEYCTYEQPTTIVVSGNYLTYTDAIIHEPDEKSIVYVECHDENEGLPLVTHMKAEEGDNPSIETIIKYETKKRKRKYNAKAMDDSVVVNEDGEVIDGYGKRKKGLNRAEIRKKARNMGQAYFNSRNKKVEGKKFENVDCQCRKRCFDKISEEARRKIFDIFWKMGAFTTQNVYMCGLVIQKTPKQRRPKDSSRPLKATSNIYRFQVGGNSVDVCKEYFLKTLQVSGGRLDRALVKMRLGQQIDSDNRGRNTPVNKISEDRLQIVRSHISSFPTTKAGYSKKRYLQSNLNVRAMYKMYKGNCESANIPPVEESIYRRTFNNDFNLQFAPPMPKE